MCNLYTMRLSADEVRGLLSHYKLYGQDWTATFIQDQKGLNEAGYVYPKGKAPVLAMKDGKLTLEQMKWGLPAWMPPLKPGEKEKRPRFVSNVRNTDSMWWRRWLAGSYVVHISSSKGLKEKLLGGRCLVPASAFAEPDENTRNPRVNRWFKRADGLPFFFAGVWREWVGDHGTIEKPDVGKHRLFGFLTTDPCEDVSPYHTKASPVVLRSSAAIEKWLHGTPEEALELQKPLLKNSLVVVPEKRRQPSAGSAPLEGERR